MSPKFVKEFKKSQKCSACNERTGKGRSVCADHLVKAREVWMLWSVIRRRKGQCSYCNRVADVKGTIRCRIHRAYNIQKCRSWHALHGVEADQRAVRKREQFVLAARGAGDVRTKTQILAERGLIRRQRRETLFNELAAKYPHIVAAKARRTRRSKASTSSLTPASPMP